MYPELEDRTIEVALYSLYLSYTFPYISLEANSIILQYIILSVRPRFNGVGRYNYGTGLSLIAYISIYVSIYFPISHLYDSPIHDLICQTEVQRSWKIELWHGTFSYSIYTLWHGPSSTNPGTTYPIRANPSLRSYNVTYRGSYACSGLYPLA